MLHGEVPLQIQFATETQTLHLQYIDEIVSLVAIPRDKNARLVNSSSLGCIMEDETFNFEGLNEYTFQNSVPVPTFTRVGSHNRSWKTTK